MRCLQIILGFIFIDTQYKVNEPVNVLRMSDVDIDVVLLMVVLDITEKRKGAIGNI